MRWFKMNIVHTVGFGCEIWKDCHDTVCVSVCFVCGISFMNDSKLICFFYVTLRPVFSGYFHFHFEKTRQSKKPVINIRLWYGRSRVGSILKIMVFLLWCDRLWILAELDGTVLMMDGELKNAGEIIFSDGFCHISATNSIRILIYQYFWKIANRLEQRSGPT